MGGKILALPVMSDRYGIDYPDDEPVIGGSYSPSAAPPPPALPQYIGAQSGEPYIGDPGQQYFDEEAGEYGDDEYDDEDDAYEYYEDDYDSGVPARQPMFYVFVALAALVGGIVVFLLFSVVNNSGGDDGGGGGDTKFAVSIDSPPKDQRIQIGKTEEVRVQASATESIARFELFVGDRLADSVDVTETPQDNKYRAVLKLVLPSKGNYDIFVRVTSSSGATKESNKVRVIAIEPVGERPQTIKGKVVADTTMRAGPGDNYPESGTLKAGQEVTILGKSKAVDWLLIDSAQGNGRWAKRSAIDPLDSLELVPIRDVTPTPAPTQQPTNTAVPSPSPSATGSPSPTADAPDFVPKDAQLTSGGSVLRVTVSNVGANAYNGPLVIGVGGDVQPGGDVAFQARITAGGSATFEIEVNPAITEKNKKAVITIDPRNAVKELREDNNGATFVLLPAEEAPDIVIQAPVVQPSAISIVIQNKGGALSATNVTLRVKLGASETSQSQSVALAKDQTATFSVARPVGSGPATAEVVINGQVVASSPFTVTP